MSQLQGNVVIVLLTGLLLMVALGPMAGCRLSAPTWDYRIESIEDLHWQNTMSELGDQGWELTSARRAVRGEGTEGHGLYECIFKRPKALFRLSPERSEKTAAEKAAEELDRMRETGEQGR